MFMRWFEHGQVYHPDKVLDPLEVKRAEPFEDVWLKTPDGVSVNGWFFACSPDAARKELVVLICHGNAGNISGRVDLSQTLLRLGLNIFQFDYRGYGRSEGKPGEEGTYLDAQAAYRWLRTKGFAGRNIIVCGESLGGGIASELCWREETGGLISQSTFTNLQDLGVELYSWLLV